MCNLLLRPVLPGKDNHERAGISGSRGTENRTGDQVSMRDLTQQSVKLSYTAMSDMVRNDWKMY